MTTAGDVPDGTYTVSGHDDATYRTFAAARRTPAGQYDANVSTTIYGSA